MRWRAGAVCALGVGLAMPEWLPRAWTREDGVVEYASFGCYLVAGLWALRAATRSRSNRGAAIAAGVLGLLLLGVAGEEISWGQRIVGVDTPAALVDGNQQDELNLHNIDGLQDKAVVGQLALAAMGALLPVFARWRTARAGWPFFTSYLAYRATRAVAGVLDWAPAGDNAEAAELLLAIGLLLLVRQLAVRSRTPSADPDPKREPAEMV